MDLAEYRRQNEQVWRRMAAGWYDRREQIWDVSSVIGEWLVERAEPQSGDTVLELAAGAGDSGFVAAQHAARLISTDLAPEMVEAARRHAEEIGVENAEFRVMDAEKMDLPDDSVDCVLCRWGYMLMADPAAALRETRRVLREGGRLAFSVWAEPGENTWGSLPTREMIERGHMPPPEPGAPGLFALADEGRLRAVLSEAGFETVEIEIVAMTWVFADFEEYWNFLTNLAGGLAMMLEGLPDAELESVREAIERRVAPLHSDDGRYEMPGLCLNVLAR